MKSKQSVNLKGAYLPPLVRPPRAPKPFQEQLWRDERYPGHAVFQTGPASFFIFLLSQERNGAVIHAMADQLLKAETKAEAFEVVRQMHEYNLKRERGAALLVPSQEPVQLVKQNGELLH